MPRRIATTVISGMLLFAPLALSFRSPEQPIPPPHGTGEWISVLPHPLDPEKIIAASSSGIYEKGPDRTWTSLWQADNMASSVHKVVRLRGISSQLFALTENGVQRGDLESKRWRQIFRGKTAQENNVLAMTSGKDPERWWIGTSDGIFESHDSGRSWNRSFPALRSPVGFLAFSGGRLFAGSGEKFFVSSGGRDLKPVRLFAAAALSDPGETAPENTASEEDAAEAGGRAAVTALTVSGENPDLLWLATERGIYESRDRGESWAALASAGMMTYKITDLLYQETSGRLIAGTPRGLYAAQPGDTVWKSIDPGFELADIRSMVFAGTVPESLLVLTAKGVETYALAETPPGADITFGGSPAPLFEKLIALEPNVRQVQEAVIRYANLGNGKIDRWQLESRLRALVPSCSVGRDFSASNSIDLDRGGTGDPDRYIVGPDSSDRSWSADLSWDLGDLIWSSDQTSIDSRQKLAVELRHELLAEATRVYFERRRIQAEVLLSAGLSCGERFEKIFRLEELSAHLDGMTGGYFMKELLSIRSRYPEMNRPWDYSNACETFQTAETDPAAHKNMPG